MLAPPPLFIFISLSPHAAAEDLCLGLESSRLVWQFLDTNPEGSEGTGVTEL